MFECHVSFSYRTMTGILTSTAVLTYVASELIFLVLFYLYLLPRANRTKANEIEEYRDFPGRTRSKLLDRTIDRLQNECTQNGKPFLTRVEQFLGEWFQVCGNIEGTGEGASISRAADTSLRETSGSSSSSTDTDSSSEDEWQTIDKPNSPFLRRGDTDIFFAWAFFGKPYDALVGWEREELNGMYDTLSKRTGMRFDQQGTTPGIRPMRLTLDEVRATYRPLFVYGIFASLNVFASLVLLCCGFLPYKSRSGLTYWHREGQKDTATSANMPLLFNHGIAPGGLALYLPMLLYGFGPFCKDSFCCNRDMILFENQPISFRPCFSFVDEDAFVAGVHEAMEKCLDSEQLAKVGVTVMGHSFGSCQITWMLRNEDIRRHVRQVLLIDPVSILLSEPDVMTNFLYAGREPSVSFVEALRPIALFPLYYVLDLLRPATKSREKSASFRSYSSLSTGKAAVSGKYNKIRMVQSELWIEHYLRRNFAWYNSELWLDQHIPPHADVIIAISGSDEILSPSKVHAEAMRYKRENADQDVKVIYWPGAGHAYAIPRPWTWTQIRAQMKKNTGTSSKNKET